MKKRPKDRSCAKIAALMGLSGDAGKQMIFRQSRGISPIPDFFKSKWVKISDGQIRLEDTINLPEGGLKP
jgi:hypothetical protein